MSMEMLKIFVTVLTLIRALIGDIQVIKYMITLNKENWDGKEVYYQRKTWEKVYAKCLKHP